MARAGRPGPIGTEASPDVARLALVAPAPVVAAVATNVAGGVYQVALAAGGRFQANAGIEGKTWLTAPGMFVTVGSLVAAVALLRRVRPRAA